MKSIILSIVVLTQIIFSNVAFAIENPALCLCLNTQCKLDEFHSTNQTALERRRLLDHPPLDILPPQWRGAAQQCIGAVQRKVILLEQIRQTRARFHNRGFYPIEETQMLLANQENELRNLQRQIATATEGSLGLFGRTIPFIVLIASPREAAMPPSHLRLVPQCSEQDIFAAQVSATADEAAFSSTLLHLFENYQRLPVGTQSPRYYRISGGRVALRVLDSVRQDSHSWPWAVHGASWQLSGNGYRSVRGALPQRYMFRTCFEMASSGIDVNLVGTPSVSTEMAPSPEPPAAIPMRRPMAPPLPLPLPEALPSAAAVTFVSDADLYCSTHEEDERCLERAFEANGDAFCQDHHGHPWCDDLDFYRQGRSYCTTHRDYSICRMVERTLNPEAFCNDPRNARSDDCEWRRFNSDKETYCRRNPDYGMCFYLNEARFCSTHQTDDRCLFRANEDSFCDGIPTHYLCAERDYSRNPRIYCDSHAEFWQCQFNAFNADPITYCATHSSEMDCETIAYVAAPGPYCNGHPKFLYCIFPELGERAILDNQVRILRGH